MENIILIIKQLYFYSVSAKPPPRIPFEPISPVFFPPEQFSFLNRRARTASKKVGKEVTL